MITYHVILRDGIPVELVSIASSVRQGYSRVISDSLWKKITAHFSHLLSGTGGDHLNVSQTIAERYGIELRSERLGRRVRPVTSSISFWALA